MDRPDNIDDVDTAPVVACDDARVVFQSAIVQPGEEAELILAPDRDLSDPLLFVSVNPQDAAVSVDQIDHGQEHLVANSYPVTQYKFGRPTRVTVSRSCPIKIFLSNQDMRAVRIGASLVAGEVRTTTENEGQDHGT
jgi:hypothetical protein